MSIYRRFPSQHLPSLITTNTYKRQPIFANGTPCELLTRTIYNIREEIRAHLIAFVIMPDHLHLILVPPPGQLGRVVQLIKGRFARAHNRHVGRTGSVWQSRYHERTLRHERALMQAIEYVHGNPVVAGLVKEARSYRWSSANEKYETDFAQYLGQAEA